MVELESAFERRGETESFFKIQTLFVLCLPSQRCFLLSSVFFPSSSSLAHGKPGKDKRNVIFSFLSF